MFVNFLQCIFDCVSDAEMLLQIQEREAVIKGSGKASSVPAGLNWASIESGMSVARNNECLWFIDFQMSNICFLQLAYW